MKRRKRKIKTLYHRWRGSALGLESSEIATALERAGLIEVLDSEHFKEVEGPKLPLEVYEKLVNQVLKNYVKNRGAYG